MSAMAAHLTWVPKLGEIMESWHEWLTGPWLLNNHRQMWLYPEGMTSQGQDESMVLEQFPGVSWWPRRAQPLVHTLPPRRSLTLHGIILLRSFTECMKSLQFDLRSSNICHLSLKYQVCACVYLYVQEHILKAPSLTGLETLDRKNLERIHRAGWGTEHHSRPRMSGS